MMNQTPELPANTAERAGTGSAAHAESTKPITIVLADDLLKRLKVIAILREISVSELLADAAAAVVKKELKKALSKIAGE